MASGKKLGVIGELHPRVAGNFELSGATYIFEIDIAALMPFAIARRVFRPIPRFPAIVRDMALVVDAGIINQRVLDIVKGYPLVTGVELFDVYSGEQVPPGKKSLAYRIIFQSPTQTLTDDEVSSVMKQILEKLAGELGAVLRG